MNEEEKKKRMADKEKDRLHQIYLIEEYNRILDKQDKQRADEWAARENKIKKSMERMGDVVKKNNNAEKEFEARIVKDAIAKGKV